MFGGPGAWDNAQKSRQQCPADGCNGDEAAFFQVQIRSADEPMTSFFKVKFYILVLHLQTWLIQYPDTALQCMTCGHRWREN